MLSGDNQRTVNAIARHVGIDEAQRRFIARSKDRAHSQVVERIQASWHDRRWRNDTPAMAAARSASLWAQPEPTLPLIKTADIALM
jgi:cation transport ATPase